MPPTIDGSVLSAWVQPAPRIVLKSMRGSFMAASKRLKSSQPQDFQNPCESSPCGVHDNGRTEAPRAPDRNPNGLLSVAVRSSVAEFQSHVGNRGTNDALLCPRREEKPGGVFQNVQCRRHQPHTTRQPNCEFRKQAGWQVIEDPQKRAESEQRPNLPRAAAFDGDARDFAGSLRLA
jgi:hypothetical protein